MDRLNSKQPQQLRKKSATKSTSGCHTQRLTQCSNIWQVRWKSDNFRTNHLVKIFWKSVHICQCYHQTSSGLLFFWDTVLDLRKSLHIVELRRWNFTAIYGCVENFQLGASGGAGPLNLNLGPPIISETTGARKYKLKTQLDVVKYSLRVQIFFRYLASRGEQGPLM